MVVVVIVIKQQKKKLQIRHLTIVKEKKRFAVKPTNEVAASRPTLAWPHDAHVHCGLAAGNEAMHGFIAHSALLHRLTC